MNEIKKQLSNFLSEPTNIVLENIPFTGELTHFLFSEKNIKKIYLIKYESSIVNQAREAINNKEVCNIESLTTSHFNDEAIIFCLNNSNYFNPNFSLIYIQKDIKALCLLGFSENFFSSSSRPKSKNCIVFNKSISELIISEKSIHALQSQTDISKSRVCHNRNLEKDSLVNFLANANERLLIIHGFPGYGKSNLLDELKRKAPNREYIPFIFESKSDTYKDIISELSPYFSLNVSLDELSQTRINDRSKRELVKTFFNSFNSRNNSTLIFESVHKILDHDNNPGLFVSLDIKLFFELLITHPQYKSSNKIIFLSRSPLQLNDEIRKFSTEIKVKELEPFYIKRIMADEYNKINRPELSVKIGTFPDDEKIAAVICGHPTLALRFVDASLKHGLEELLNNEDFRSKIGYELKVKWLMDNYPLEESEKNVLELLALFNSELPDNFINVHFTNAHSVLEKLVNRYLVDVRFYADGGAKYFVPNIIKDYIKGICKPEVIRENHVIIADYYWNKAEDITVSSQEKILFYRKAFYHFRESKNYEKLKLLVFRFREKFIIEAMEATREKLWRDAFFYFNELHEYNQIGIENPKEYIQFIKVLSRISPKPKNADKLIEEIHNMFPFDSFISVTYADYLFDKKEYQLSKSECNRIKNLMSEDKSVQKDMLSSAIIDNTLAKCEYKLGNKTVAHDLVEKWKKHFIAKRLDRLNNREKYHYQSILMTEFEGLNCYEEYMNEKKNLVVELTGINKTGKATTIPFLSPTNRNTYCLEGEWQYRIEKQFSLTKAIRQDDKLLASESNFKNHIISQTSLQKYIDLSKQELTVTSVQKHIDRINTLIQNGKSVLQQIRDIDKSNTHFQSNYATCSLLQVESDFHLIKMIVNN